MIIISRGGLAIISTIIYAIMAMAIVICSSSIPQVHSEYIDVSPAMILAVGDVTTSSVRILHEALSTTISPSEALTPTILPAMGALTETRPVIPVTATERIGVQWVTVTYENRLLHKDKEPVFTSPTNHSVMITSGVRPSIMIIDQLQPNTTYVVCFYRERDYPAGKLEDERKCTWSHPLRVQFTTLIDHSQPANLTLLAFSCDHSGQDGDRSVFRHMTSTMAMDPHTVAPITIHMGDQVYADDLFKSLWAQRYDADSEMGRVLRTFPSAANGAHEVIIEAWRQLHRDTFGQTEQQSVLRRGSHWMVTDDHE